MTKESSLAAALSSRLDKIREAERLLNENITICRIQLRLVRLQSELVLFGFTETEVERILCDTRLIKVDESYPNIRHFTDTIDELLRINRVYKNTAVSKNSEIDMQKLNSFIGVQKQVLVSDITVLGVLDQSALVKCTVKNTSSSTLSSISLALVGGDTYDSILLPELRSGATAELNARLKFPEESPSPFGFSVFVYILWQTSENNRFLWKAVDELIIDDFNDDIVDSVITDISDVFYSIKRRFLVRHKMLSNEECYKALSTILNDCIRADTAITRVAIHLSDKGVICTTRSRKKYHLNRCLTRLEYYFGSDYVAEEISIPVEFVSDLQGELKDAHGQMYQQLCDVHGQIEAERGNIDIRVREYQRRKLIVSQGRLRAEHCMEEIEHKMQEE